MDAQSWFNQFRESEDYKLLQKKPLAYFSIEYALSDMLPTYAGGLGILAGDYVKELADQKIPAVALGLYYQKRYGFDPHDPTDTFHPVLTPEEQGLTLVTDKNNNPIIVSVPIKGNQVFVKAWLWKHHSVPVFLLDTNLPENSQSDRLIGEKLYTSDKETRLMQEMVLGIAGFRLLEVMGFTPSLYHMNEGHSALLVLEIIRHEMQKRHIGFAEAIKLASHHVVFTDHTLVPAGNDIFSNELMGIMLERYASELAVPVQEIVALGTVEDSHDFSLLIFAMRLAGKINGVSQLHVTTAKKVWPDYDLEPVTNGIHLDSWKSIHSHDENKKELLAHIQKETGMQWDEKTLLLGWARRMVRYKRPLALFEDLGAFLKLATDQHRPVHVVLGGVAHQADDAGQEILAQIQEIVKKSHNTVIFLPHYNKTLAGLLVSGCDVWLNTPVVGSEACGTSGMKALLNGTLPVSTKDGWMAEVAINTVGWSLESDTVNASLLTTLREYVIPTFYDHSEDWKEKQRAGKELITTSFSATRMLKDYFEKAYLPILQNAYEHYGV